MDIYIAITEKKYTCTQWLVVGALFLGYNSEKMEALVSRGPLYAVYISIKLKPSVLEYMEYAVYRMPVPVIPLNTGE